MTVYSCYKTSERLIIKKKKKTVWGVLLENEP